MDIEVVTIQKEESIIEALKMMDNVCLKSLLVFDKDRFYSLVTIGEIQRAIIKNVDLHSSIESILNVEGKTYAFITEGIDSIRNKMLKIRAQLMPVLDEKGNLVNLYCWSDFFPEEVAFPDREKLDLPVVIMAGGKGTRLMPLTNVIPKPLVPVGEKTILETILDRFEAIGCNRFYISVNYKSNMIRYYLEQQNHKYNVHFFEEDKPLGTIGSVSMLKGIIKTPFFVSTCDNLIDQDFRDVYDYHVSNNNDMTMVTAVKSFKIPYGVIETGPEGLMTSLREKPESTFMINTGAYLLNAELIDEIPVGSFYHITDLMEKVRKRGGRVGCFPISEHSWIDMGEWREYLKLINVI